MRIEPSIINHLVHNEEYTRQVLPFLKQEYFKESSERIVFELVDAYVKSYTKIPTKEALFVELANRDNLNESDFEAVKSSLEKTERKDVDVAWLLDKTEKFCQDQAMVIAIRKSVAILDDNSPEGRGAIPQMMSDALSVSFDSSVGHDFLLDYKDRYDFYHKKEKRVSFSGLEYMNKITGGGLPQKTLNVILAGVNTGKSLFMCHCAADNLAAGLNVLYITLELSQEMVAQRIDANLMNTDMSDIKIMLKDVYEKKMEKIREKTPGNLIIKEYPTAQAGSSHFRHLLNELKIKKSFKPDIIYIDYLNICTSSRLKMNNTVNSYSFIKSIAEELRGLAVEYNLPIVTATQATRTGHSSSEIEMTDVSESFALAATADFMFAVISTEDMQERGQYLIKQLKSRYGDPSMNRKCLIGVDKAKMKLYDIEGVQENVLKPEKEISKLQNDFFSAPKKPGYDGPITSKFYDFK